MKKELLTRLDQYKSQAKANKQRLLPLTNKMGLAGTAILASIVNTPVELNAQIVCGNMGAPTRTVGSCTGDIGFLNSYNCAKFDFDHDGINELQIYYYNWSGIGSTANAYLDPTNNDLALFGKGDHTAGFTFPGNPVAQTWSYYLMYQDRIYVVPLSGGGGYGFITFDSRAHPAGTNHPTTNQPICCYHSALPTMWGAQSGINSLSDINILTSSITECPDFPNLLPVELSSFKASLEDKSIILDWTTETETNNAGFEIERSMDGIIFEKMKFIHGKGTTTTTQQYTFRDNKIKSATQYYYRLRQVDFDGKFKYSNIIAIKSSSAPISTKVFPNPAHNSINLQVNTSNNTFIDLTIYDMSGKIVKEIRKETSDELNTLTLDTSNWSNGSHYIKIKTDQNVSYEKVLISH